MDDYEIIEEASMVHAIPVSILRQCLFNLR